MRKYEVYSFHKIEDIIPQIANSKNCEKYICLGSRNLGVKVYTNRMRMFKQKGTRCVSCGISGKFFAVCKNYGDESAHLNLFAMSEDGKPILMTKDHIVPRSRNGSDSMLNLQPMC